MHHLIECNLCDFEIVGSHKCGGEWFSDGDSHWNVCKTCGEEYNREKHIFKGDICKTCGCEKYILGDVDNDRDVDSDDSIYLLYNIFFGNEEYPINQPCDFDGNGSMDSDDSIYLLYNIFFGDEEYPLASGTTEIEPEEIVIGVDNVTITEQLTTYDENGDPIEIKTAPNSKPENLFDGNTTSGGLWVGNGSFWSANTGAKLTIDFDEAIMVSRANISLCVNAWPCIGFSFYRGDELVGAAYGDWGQGEGNTPLGNTDDRWTFSGDKTIDFAELLDLEGKIIDRVVITMDHVRDDVFNYNKISEIDIMGTSAVIEF
jgi:hypothetical protein